MFTATEYRVKADEYARRCETARSASERKEFHDLERSFRTLAENQEWVDRHARDIVHSEGPR